MPAYIPDAIYVSNFLLWGQREYEGLHRKMAEIEALRYGETKTKLPASERPTGQVVRTLMTSDLIESVKAAVTTNPPRAHFDPLRQGDAANKNGSKREAFWNAHLGKMLDTYSEFADAVIGLGFGFIKSSYNPWPVVPRKKKKGESDRDYNRRQRGLKQRWGLPYASTTPHPMTIYPRLGIGNDIVELLEHGYRPKVDVYATYRLGGDSDVTRKSRALLDTGEFDERRARLLSGVSGQPDETIRPLPYGQDTSTMCKVTEYWSERVHQVYVENHLIHEEQEPHVAFFYAAGRTASSKDPDKMGMSVAENLRFNEPVIDRALTRMGEAVEVMLKPPLAIEKDVNAPSNPVIFGADNNPINSTITFEPGKATALTAGQKVVNPFEGVVNIYQAMPWLQQMWQVVSQHGVAPIFKGMPPGASGSGYRDNSLYLMAKSMFNYIVQALARALTDYITWLEQQCIEFDQELWIGNLSLRPKDIEDFPCTIEVKLDPVLPQNLIAEAQLYMEAHAQGFFDRRTVLEKGFKEEQPEDILDARLLEKAEEMLIDSVLIPDAFQRLGIGAAAPIPAGGAGGSGLVDTAGNPLAPSQPRGPGGAQQLLSETGGGSGGTGGRAAGQSRQPPFQAGSFPPS